VQRTWAARLRVGACVSPLEASFEKQGRIVIETSQSTENHAALLVSGLVWFECLCSTKLCVEPNPQYNSIKRWGLYERLGHKGATLMNDIIALCS
jgi:hypothetical protein